MTILYYTSSTGSDPAFVAAFSAGIHDLECEQVDMLEHTTMGGENFYDINSTGCAPCLVLDDGSIINNRMAILHYIDEFHSGDDCTDQYSVRSDSTPRSTPRGTHPRIHAVLTHMRHIPHPHFHAQESLKNSASYHHDGHSSAYHEEHHSMRQLMKHYIGHVSYDDM